MIGSIKYEDMENYSTVLLDSSKMIKEIVGKYNIDDFSAVVDFCDKIESYSRFLSSSVDLFKDSDLALQSMIEKNK